MGTQQMAARAGTVEIDYPTSDGKPMAETEFHVNAMIDLIDRLKRWFATRDAYVVGNMFLYYREGDPRSVVAPDVYVVFGVSKRVRRTFKVWEEGAVPAVVFEVTSRKTRREDRAKRDVYERLGVAEYFMYDPEAASLDPPLQGFRLVADSYQPVAPDATGVLHSVQLGLDLRLDGLSLELYDARSGERLLRSAERADAEQQRADAQQQRADALAAEVARLRAERQHGEP